MWWGRHALGRIGSVRHAVCVRVEGGGAGCIQVHYVAKLRYCRLRLPQKLDSSPAAAEQK
jgi:hypothetical protein